MKDRFKRAVDAAIMEFWDAIAREYPEAETGDLSPLDTIAFTEGCIIAVRSWLRSNIQIACVMSSHGVIHADKRSGKVLIIEQHDSQNPDEDFVNIEGFDVEEYEKYHGHPLDDECDILDLGCYVRQADGSIKYGPAEENYRKEKMYLPKGKSIECLGYKIHNCLNDDGIVLMREGDDAKDYECHLGNFGPGTEENVDYAKRYCILHFMIARPEIFSATMVYRMMGRGGQMHEYYKFKDAVIEAGLEMPDEITCGEGLNAQVYFKGKEIPSKN